MNNTQVLNQNSLDFSSENQIFSCNLSEKHLIWDQVISNVALRIRESINLTTILQTAADEVRQLLGCDRVLLYRFETNCNGIVVMESVSDPCWSLLNFVVQDPCFNASWIEPYLEGRYWVMNDVSQANLTPCHAEFLTALHVQANLAIPILYTNQLWGLLIPHSCQGPRVWTQVEIEGLQKLAVQIGIAIYQATLIEQLQTAKADLEAQVAARTTELAQANEQLARLAAIVDSSEDAILSLTPEGRINSWNQAAERLLGYSAEEIIGQPLFVIVPPDRHPEAQGIVQRISQGEKVATLETQRQHKDGTLIDVALTVFQVRDRAGRVIGNSGILRNISAQLKAERFLIEQASILSIFYETSPLMMGTVELSENDILHVAHNPSTLQFFGLSSEKVTGKWASEIGVFPEHIKLWMKHYRRSQMQQKPTWFEYEHIGVTQTFWLLVTVNFIGFSESQRPQFSFIVQDVSDRKTAEENLLKSEQLGRELKLLENILEIISAGYWDWQLTTNEKYLSPGFKQMFGYQNHELPNSLATCQSLVVPEDLPKLIGCFEGNIQSRGDIPCQTEVRYRHKDGSIVWVQCFGQVIEWDEVGNARRMIGCHIDITHRKQAELQLHSLSERLTLALNSGQIGTWDWSLGNEVSWDDRMYEIYGICPSDRSASYQTWLNALHPDDQVPTEKQLQASLQSGQDWDVEFRIQRANDHQWRWIKAFARLVFDPEGNVINMIGINYDITDQKKVEADLESAKSQLELVIQASSEGFWDWNLLTGEIYFSPQWKAMLGYAEHELENKFEMWGSLIYQEDYTTVQQLIDDYNSGKIDHFEATQRFHHKNGSTVYVLSRAIHLKDEQGNVIRMVGSHLDMTPMVKIQESLKTSQMQLSGVLDSSIDGIMALRSVRNSQGQIVDFEYLLSNPNACKLVGKPIEELIGSRMLEKFPGHLQDELFERYVRVVESGQTAQREFYYNHEGLDSWFQTIAVKLSDGFAVTFRDITSIKNSEQALQQANQNLESYIQDLKARNAEMHSLSEMSDFLQACVTVEEACEAIASLLEPIFPGCSGNLLITAASRNQLENVASWGAELCSEEIFIPQDCWGLRRGQIHLVGPNRSGPRCKHIHFDADPQGAIATTLCIPMIAQGETLGLFYLGANHPEDLPKSKQQLARAVAEQVAMAIANLNLRETLHNQSIRDPLTGLFNRRYLEEALTQEFARAQRKQAPIGAIMIDVDHFKHFNDSYGHETGDRVLQAIGTLLKESVRGSDIPCRYGGEEMTLILPESSLANTAQRAEKIRAAIAELSLNFNGQSFANITASFGVAAFPQHGVTGNAVLQAADAALYRAKAAGRNCVIVAP